MYDESPGQFSSKDFAIFNHSAVAAFAIDYLHNVIFWNKACEILTGIAAETIIGTSDHWKAFYDHKRWCLVDIVVNGEYDELAKLYTRFGNSILIKDGLHAEGWYENLGCKRRYIIFDAVPLYNQEGRLVGAMETLQDVTEQKAASDENEKQVAELQKVAQKNLQLKGLIPVCASCKKIRDEHGKWLPFEKYISERSNADFSHAICQVCAAKLYPEYYKD